MDCQHVRPDCRRFVCDQCAQVVYICSWCDRGQRYCSDECRRRARRQNQREANQRYQRTRRGRLLHAQRQAAYRARQRAPDEKVTHHSCHAEVRPARVISCVTRRPKRSVGPSTLWVDSQNSPPSPPPSPYFVCCVCGHRCEPYIRGDFLRCRRPGS